MYFGLSEDQIRMQESLRGTLERNASLDVIRAIVDGDMAARSALAGELEGLAIEHILIPEAHGGLGLGLLEAAILQEMLGRYVVPTRFTSTILASIGIIHGGDAPQAAEFFGAMLKGEMRLGLGINETIGARAGDGVLCGGEGLQGRASFVMDCENATHYLLAAKVEGGAHCLVLVARDAGGITHTPLRSIDKTRDFALLNFANTPYVMLKGNDHAHAIAQTVAAGRVMFAIDTFGACEVMLEKAVAYAKERRQFNRVIGSFQAVKHMGAGMAASLEPCRALVWYAAHAYDAAPDEFALMSRHAKSLLGDVGQQIARTATEIHGGMGITELLGLHYWFKRIGVDRQFLGNPATLRREAAQLQF